MKESILKSIKMEKVHGWISQKIDFQDNITIIYGSNGTGKTTILNVLANILQGEIHKFFEIDFEQIEVSLNNDKKIMLKQKKNEIIISLIEKNSMDELSINKKQCFETGPNTEKIYFINNENTNSKTLYYEKIQKIISGFLQIKNISYFPAFRKMFEILNTQRDSYESRHYINSPYNKNYILYNGNDKNHIFYNELIQEILGKFVPTMHFITINQIEKIISNKINEIIDKVNDKNKSLLLNTYKNIVNTAMKGKKVDISNEDLKELQTSIKKSQDFFYGKNITFMNSFFDIFLHENSNNPLSKEMRKILIVTFLKAFKDLSVFQEEEISAINKLFFAVNKFLYNKKLAIPKVYKRKEIYHFVECKGKITNCSLSNLSSGEKQIINMFYSIFFDSKNSKILLIDEPEISLHIDWQRRLVPELMKNLKKKQLIICTHSPEVGAEFLFGDEIINLDEGRGK